MATTSIFLSASPAQKSEMIEDGMLNINAQLSKLSTETQVLTGWLKLMKPIVDEMPNAPLNHAKLIRLRISHDENISQLSEQLTRLSESLSTFVAYERVGINYTREYERVWQAAKTLPAQMYGIQSVT